MPPHGGGAPKSYAWRMQNKVIVAGPWGDLEKKLPGTTEVFRSTREKISPPRRRLEKVEGTAEMKLGLQSGQRKKIQHVTRENTTAGEPTFDRAGECRKDRVMKKIPSTTGSTKGERTAIRHSRGREI